MMYGVGIPLEALKAAPRVNWKHVDGPMLMWAGSVDWLTWRERIALWFGRESVESLAQKRWPIRKHWSQA